MNPSSFENVTTLTFDIFGTVLDLTGSLVPPIRQFLSTRQASIDASEFWVQWRARQRLEQYQDTLIGAGHSGYVETCRRAFIYTLRANGIEFTNEEADDFMEVWQGLVPFDDAVKGLEKLKGRYKLVALSNGNKWLLEHLTRNQISVPFDAVISVDEAGAFKPHPSVYRTAARMLELEPSQIMMVAAHSFDIMGARASGYRGAFVNRYRLPFEESPYRPDIIVNDFIELSSRLARS